ncbi:MAG: hypothetical protein AAFR77_05380, partial [Cyanobacteria bacterium J06631_2]
MQSLKTTIGNKVRETLGIQASFVGRKLTVFPDDLFLVSHPKSGNTWIKLQIKNLIQVLPDLGCETRNRSSGNTVSFLPT